MKQTWRWFGPSDNVSVDDMLQAGVEGVVTALHHIPNGTVWSPAEIAQRQQQMSRMADGSPSHLAWDVVESLPVSEAIKKQDGDWRDHITAYKDSLRNLADAGIYVVCYNFMPVIDWTRTDLRWRLPHGGTCMRFDYVDFAAFDIHILRRNNATDSYADDIVAAAADRFADMSDDQAQALADNVVCGLPGANQNLQLSDVRELLAQYDDIDTQRLRQNHIDFLEQVAPYAEEIGVRLCCHPDDPPFPLLGLPRIMSTEADYDTLMAAVDTPANGITLCAGSLGARGDNDIPGMMQRLGDRVHFLHIRNVKLDTPLPPGSFYEAEHLNGDTDIVRLMSNILAEEKRRKAAGRADWELPIRPDHGHDILDDLKRQTQPGYPSIGRVRGLAELRGVMTALTAMDNAAPDNAMPV